MTEKKQETTLTESIQCEGPEAWVAQSTVKHGASVRILYRQKKVGLGSWLHGSTATSCYSRRPVGVALIGEIHAQSKSRRATEDSHNSGVKRCPEEWKRPSEERWCIIQRDIGISVSDDSTLPK